MIDCTCINERYDITVSDVDRVVRINEKRLEVRAGVKGMLLLGLPIRYEGIESVGLWIS